MESGAPWEAVEAALEADSPLEARVLLLRAWRARPHPRLADLVEACDLALDRVGQSSAVLHRSDPDDEGLFGSLARGWHRASPSRVTERLQRFQRSPDPALTPVLLELLRGAEPRLVSSVAFRAAAAEVLVTAGDVRAVPSLERLLGSAWPYGDPALALRCVPPLEAVLRHLRHLPPPPGLEVPEGVARRLAPELAAVSATAVVSPMDPAEELAQLARYAGSPTPAARALLADWLTERGDARGALLSASGGEPDLVQQCLARRLERRWLARAPEVVTRIELRAGWPWHVELFARDAPGLQDTAAWPPWSQLGSARVAGWRDELLPALAAATSLRSLSGVPCRQVARLPEEALARLEDLSLNGLDWTMDPPADQEESLRMLNTRVPALTTLVLFCPQPEMLCELRPMPALRTLRVLDPVEEAVVEALARMEGPDRLLAQKLTSHEFRGGRQALRALTSVAWMDPRQSAETWIRDLEPTRRLRDRLGPGVTWTLDPALEARFPEVAAWWRTPSGA